MSNDEKAGIKTALWGRYLYCLIDGSVKINLGKIGLDGNEVYTIPFNDISAVVHDCPCEPYKSDDNDLVKRWAIIHEKVVEDSLEKFGNVLPFGFDTIIKGDAAISSDENIRIWLRDEYSSLKKKMDRIRGKNEYGIQIFLDSDIVADEIRTTNIEFQSLDQEIKSKPAGMAYMLKGKLDNLLKTEIGIKADIYRKEIYGRIKGYVDEVRVEKTKKADGNKQMLLNLSCLLDKGKVTNLGDMLEIINKTEGFSVRFTGPWPPYSFVVPG